MVTKGRIPARPAAGFTLVEVMVALMIVSMALPALVMLVMAQVDGAAHIRDKSYAMWIAENQLTRISLLNNKGLFPTYKLPEKDTGQTEMMGLQWQWQVDVGADERVPGLLRIDIAVDMIGVAGERNLKADDLDKADPLARLTGYMSE